MTKEEKDIFFKYQDQILENLETLRINLDSCEEMGMIDEDEIIHNEIVDLIDEVKIVDSSTDLFEIIIRAKVIETRIDSWYSKEGITNIELNWPLI